MISKEIFLFSLMVVEEKRQSDRHPDDPKRYPWGEADIAFLNRVYIAYQESVTDPKPEFDPQDPHFVEKIAEYAQELINNYQEVSAPSIPSNIDELVQDLDTFKKQQEQLIAEQSKQKPKMAQARIELLKRLNIVIPKADNTTKEFITNQTLLNTPPEQWQQTIRDTAKDLRILAEITKAPITDEALIATLTAVAPYFAEVLPELAEVIEEVEIVAPQISEHVVMAAILNLPVTVLQPSPQTDAAFTISSKPGEAILKTQVLAQNQVQVQEMLAQITQVMKFKERIAIETKRALEVSGLPREDQQIVVQAVNNYVAPALVFAASHTKDESEKKVIVNKNIERVFAQIGLKQYVDSHRMAINAARQAAMASFMNTMSYEYVYAIIPPQVQTFYQQRATRSPQMREFFLEVRDFGLSKVQDKVTQVALDKFWGSAAGRSIGSALGLGAKAGATVATEAAATAAVVGAEAAAGPPGWVAAAITIAVTFGKDVLSWAKRHFKELSMAVGAAIGLLFFGPIGAVLGAVGGFAISTPIASLSGTVNTIGAGVTATSTALVGLVATEIAAPIIVIALSVPIVVALVLFIINSGALIVPVNTVPLQNSNTFISELGNNINFIASGEKIECTKDPRPLEFRYDTNDTTSRAWSIVNQLQQGFWCYWNNSPQFPELFDDPEYQKYPYHCVYEPNNPRGCSGDYTKLGGDSLFWCTWLIVKAYPADRQGVLTLGANNMKDTWFINQNRFVANGPNAINKIKPGDSIFLSTGRDSPAYAGHVAIVYAVSKDFIITLDSNAATKTHSYTVASNGSILGLPGLSVIGFGSL